MGGGMMVVVIRCRTPDGKLTDFIWDEPEFVTRNYLMNLKEQNFREFKPIDYPNHWGLQFGDFVRGLNK